MRLVPMILTVSVLAGAAPALATGSAEPHLTLTLSGHRFTPDTLQAPPGVRIHVTLINRDGASEEFDSGDLRVEEDVTPRATIDFAIGPLKPGMYRFMGEAHPATAEGRIVVTAPVP